MTDPTPKASIPQADLDRIVALLLKIEKRRRIMLFGYIFAAIVLLIGEVVCLYIIGSSPASARLSWIFLIPFALTGSIMWGFGKWASSLKAPPLPAAPRSEPPRAS